MLVLGAGAVTFASAADTSRVASSIHDANELLSSARRVLQASQAHAPVHVVVSDAWLVEAEIPWAAQLLDDDAARSYVDAYLEMLGASADQVRTALDNAPYGQPRLACAISTAMFDAIVAMASERGKLACIVPLSSAVWSAIGGCIAERDCAVAIVEEAALTVMSIVAGRIRHVHTHRHGGAAVDELERFWRRLKLRDPDHNAHATLFVVDLSGHAAVLPASMQAVEWGSAATVQALRSAARFGSVLHIYRASRPTRAWQRIAAAALIACVAVGLWAVVQIQQRIGSTQQALATLDRVPSPPPKRSATQQREHDQELKVVRSQLESLDLPLDDLLAAVSPPAGMRAAILSLDMDARAGAEPAAVRLVARAESSAVMTTFVAYLADARPFHSAYLTRHELQDESSKAAYVFTVEAQWTR